MLFGKLLRKFLEIGKGRIKHQATNFMIFVCIHKSCDGSHASSPNTYTTNCPSLSQIAKNAIDIVPLIVAKGNIVTLGKSAASKVKGEDSDISAQEVVNYSVTKWLVKYPSSRQLAFPWR